MKHTAYTIYEAYKTVEADIKNKKLNIFDEEAFVKRISEKNRGFYQDMANLFSTQFSNVNPDIYMQCGFHLFKSFGPDKFFREIILNEYISRDARRKRDPNEELQSVLDSLKFIGRPIEKYLKEDNGVIKNGQKRIL